MQLFVEKNSEKMEEIVGCTLHGIFFDRRSQKIKHYESACLGSAAPFGDDRMPSSQPGEFDADWCKNGLCSGGFDPLSYAVYRLFAE